MKDFSWIYILIFVLLPMLKNVLESRSRKKQAKAKLLEMKSREQQRDFPEPLSEDEATEAELEEDPRAWVDVQPRPASASAPAPTPLEGGWVEVRDPITGAPTSVAAHPAMRLEPRSHLDPPQDPIDLLDQLRMELMETSRSSSELEDQNSRDPIRSRASSWSSPISVSGSDLSSGSAAPQGRLKKQQWTLTRNQLRDRLLWREILGPPVSLRPPAEGRL